MHKPLRRDLLTLSCYYTAPPHMKGMSFIMCKKIIAFVMALALLMTGFALQTNAVVPALGEMTEDTAYPFAYLDFDANTYSKISGFSIQDNTGNQITSDVVSFQGKTCAYFDNMLWVNLDADYAAPEDRNITVRITYYDDTPVNQYSFINSQYHKSGTVNTVIADEKGRIGKMDGSGTWKTASMNLFPHSVTFDNLFHGQYDFGLWCDNMAGGVYVSRVEVIVMKDDTTAPYAYIDFDKSQYSKISSYSFEDNSTKPTVSEITAYQGKGCALIDNRFWMNVLDSYIGSSDRNIAIRIEYFDLAAENQYSYVNSRFHKAAGGEIAADQSRVGKMTGGAVWKTAQFNASSHAVTFDSYFNGLYDLGLYADNMAAVYVSRIEIINLDMTEDTSSKIAYIDYDKRMTSKITKSLNDDSSANAAVSGVTLYEGKGCVFFDNFMWFNVLDDYIASTDRNISVRITYFDLPAQNQYSFVNSRFLKAAGGEIGAEQGRIGKMEGTGVWRTAQLDVTSYAVTFSSYFHGQYDLGLWCDNMASGVYVSRVEIIKTDFTEDLLSDTAYIDFDTMQYSKISSYVFQDTAGNAVASGLTEYQGKVAAIFDHFLWIKIDDDYINSDDRNIRVKITYFDGPALNQYSYINSQYRHTNGTTLANETTRIGKMTGTGVWKTAVIDLSELSVTFDNTMNSCDFNLWCDNIPEGAYVSRVEIMNVDMLSDDTTLNGISLDGVAAAIDGSRFTISLPKNSTRDLSVLLISEFTAEAAAGATVSLGGSDFTSGDVTVTVTAENETATAQYTLSISITPTTVSDLVVIKRYIVSLPDTAGYDYSQIDFDFDGRPDLDDIVIGKKIILNIPR